MLLVSLRRLTSHYGVLAPLRQQNPWRRAHEPTARIVSLDILRAVAVSFMIISHFYENGFLPSFAHDNTVLLLLLSIPLTLSQARGVFVIVAQAVGVFRLFTLFVQGSTLRGSARLSRLWAGTVLAGVVCSALAPVYAVIDTLHIVGERIARSDPLSVNVVHDLPPPMRAIGSAAFTCAFTAFVYSACLTVSEIVVRFLDRRYGPAVTPPRTRRSARKPARAPARPAAPLVLPPDATPFVSAHLSSDDETAPLPMPLAPPAARVQTLIAQDLAFETVAKQTANLPAPARVIAWLWAHRDGRVFLVSVPLVTLCALVVCLAREPADRLVLAIWKHGCTHWADVPSEFCAGIDTVRTTWLNGPVVLFPTHPTGLGRGQRLGLWAAGYVTQALVDSEFSVFPYTAMGLAGCLLGSLLAVIARETQRETAPPRTHRMRPPMPVLRTGDRATALWMTVIFFSLPLINVFVLWRVIAPDSPGCYRGSRILASFRGESLGGEVWRYHTGAFLLLSAPLTFAVTALGVHLWDLSPISRISNPAVRVRAISTYSATMYTWDCYVLAVVRRLCQALHLGGCGESALLCAEPGPALAVRVVVPYLYLFLPQLLDFIPSLTIDAIMSSLSHVVITITVHFRIIMQAGLGIAAPEAWMRLRRRLGEDLHTDLPANHRTHARVSLSPLVERVYTMTPQESSESDG